MYFEFMVLVNEDDWLLNLYLNVYKLLWRTLYLPHETLVCVYWKIKRFHIIPSSSLPMLCDHLHPRSWINFHQCVRDEYHMHAVEHT